MVPHARASARGPKQPKRGFRPRGARVAPRGGRVAETSGCSSASPRARTSAIAAEPPLTAASAASCAVAASTAARAYALSFTSRGCAASGWPASPSKSLRDMLAFLRKRASRLLPSSSLGVSGCKCSRGSCRQESASSPFLPAYNRRASLCDGLCTMKSSLWSGSDRSAPLLGTRALRGRGTTPRNPAKSAAACRCAGGASSAAFAPNNLLRSSSDKNASAGKLSSLASSALFWESASTRCREVTLPPLIAAASRYARRASCTNSSAP